MSEWMEGLKPGVQLLNLIFPDRTIRGPTPNVLKLWDEGGKNRRVVAIGSADAHCHQHKLLCFTVSIFPYRMLFRRIRTHFLTTEPLTGKLDADRDIVYETLREGRVFITNRRHGDARGFSFTARTDRQTVQMGDCTELSENPVFRISVPEPGEITLLCDGTTEQIRNMRTVEFSPVRGGSYRVEVRKKGKPWIFSNAIRILDRNGPL
jgi:hypothetical protein